MNFLTVALLVGGGLYFYNQSQSKPPVVSKPTFEYTCNILKLNADYKSFINSLNIKIEKLFKERNITKENVMNLSQTQVIDLFKYWITTLNPLCNKDISQMINDEKTITLMLFTTLSVKFIQLKQGISLKTNQVLNDFDIYEYKNIVYEYVDIIQQYLKTNYTNEQITEFNNQFKAVGIFPYYK